ncbi:MAG: hypothetical protein JNN07_26765 [Verrucomicrobiales bacterium]|nr:hypothetical protein [Verrucomicrobiales bacterium]
MPPCEVFLAAIQRRSTTIVLARNHPSGRPQPSDTDRRITHEFIKVGHTMNIEGLNMPGNTAEKTTLAGFHKSRVSKGQPNASGAWTLAFPLKHFSRSSKRRIHGGFFDLCSRRAINQSVRAFASISQNFDLRP